MRPHLVALIGLPAFSRLRVPRSLGMSFSVGVGVLFVLGCNEACAAALGSLTTSAGLFATLATLLLIQGWPAQLPGPALGTAGAMLLVALVAAWLWRARAMQRLAGFGGSSVPAAPAGAERRLSASPGPTATIALPSGVERAPLLAELRLQFVRLQAAWDLREMQSLRALTTPEMLDELCFEWPDGGPPGASNRTDVVTLHAELLGFEDVAGTHLVSVEFSGLIREAAEQGAHPFRELWMLAKDDASGWRLARQQALL